MLATPLAPPTLLSKIEAAVDDLDNIQVSELTALLARAKSSVVEGEPNI